MAVEEGNRYRIEILAGEIDSSHWDRIAFRLFAATHHSNGIKAGLWLLAGAEVTAFATAIATKSMPTEAFLIGLGCLAFATGFVCKGRPHWMRRLTTGPSPELKEYSFDDQGFEIASKDGKRWNFAWMTTEVIYEDNDWLGFHSQGMYGPVALAPLRRAGLLEEFLSRVRRDATDR